MEQTKHGRAKRYWVVFAILIVAFLVLLFLNICVGSVRATFSETIGALFHRMEGATTDEVIWKIRLPRTLSAGMLGGALALSGFLLQTFFNNPIAGPYVLGISSGAKLTVAVVMVLLLGSYRAVGSAALILAAFAGALISMGFVLLVSNKVRRASMLIVAGVMIGYICSAVTDLIITFADDASIVNLHNWSRGSFSGASWENVRVCAAVILPAAAAAFLLAKPIGAYQLGEAYAQNMGVNIRAFRVALVILSSILSACVTAFAGPISFVGIAVPQLIKALLKTAKPLIVIPACFLGGAVFCLGCDLIARTLFAPTELSISSVTALFGAPVVILAMMQKRAGRE